MTPRFSVIIPTFGRPERLLACVRSIERLDHASFEVVVADDGSPEPVEPLVSRETWAMPVSVVRQSNAGSGAARNAASKAARGEYLAFTADDCAPDPSWLTELDGAFCRPGMQRALVGGAIRHAIPDDLCATASHLLIDYLRLVFNSPSPTFFTPNNLAVHAESFRESGGFDSTIGPTGEDREFCARWLAAGRPVGEADRAAVEHEHPLSVRSFIRQQFSYGVGSARFRRRTPHASAGPVPAPLGFYARLVTHPLRVEHGPRAIGLTGLMFLSQVANAAGVIIETVRGEPSRGETSSKDQSP
ncbi:MAG: glycosyltransferase family 2 protein [Planctomycetota bacterium]